MLWIIVVTVDRCLLCGRCISLDFVILESSLDGILRQHGAVQLDGRKRQLLKRRL